MDLQVSVDNDFLLIYINFCQGEFAILTLNVVLTGEVLADVAILKFARSTPPHTTLSVLTLVSPPVVRWCFFASDTPQNRKK
jgi:hypothetical protein